jgi:hypothetical protein
VCVGGGGGDERGGCILCVHALALCISCSRADSELNPTLRRSSAVTKLSPVPILLLTKFRLESGVKGS